MILFSIGVASGLYGFTQMANGALCTVGIFPANSALSAASVLLAGILFGQYFAPPARGPVRAGDPLLCGGHPRPPAPGRKVKETLAR
jgi:hypothetical protein